MKKKISLAVALGIGASLLSVPTASADVYLPCKWPSGRSITVWRSPYVSSDFRPVQALGIWNNLEGQSPRFVTVSDKSRARVLIRRYTNSATKTLGFTNITCSGTDVRATVWINHAYRIRPKVVMRHEAGHVKGLGHVSYWSIMRPFVENMAGFPTSNDAAALRRRY